MKSILATLFFSFLFITTHWSQSTETSRSYSFLIQNGISNHLFFGDYNEDYQSPYVNAFRIQMTFQESQKFSSIIGLQYGKSGRITNWICGEDWDYCETIGVPPIEVKYTERKHYLSIIYNSKYDILNDFYIQGGLSIDFPFISSFHNRYESSTGQTSSDNESDLHGRKIILNTTFGGNLLVGKSFTINQKWKWFLELEYKMYNLIAIRFEDYEDYFYRKGEKPWVFGINTGISLQ